jgi:hypothetical protein
MGHNLARDAKRKRWNWKKRLGAFSLVLMFGCLVATAWIVWELKNWEPFTAREYYPSRPEGYEVSRIEGNADIILPPSAHDVYVYTAGFREIDTRMRFSMSAKELDEFMKSTLCQEPLRWMKTRPQSNSDGTSDWWTPNQAKHLEGCNGSKGHSHQTIMIERTDVDVYFVFVSTSTY